MLFNRRRWHWWNYFLPSLFLFAGSAKELPAAGQDDAGLARGASIQGRIVDTDGNPIPRAEVRLYRYDAPSQRWGRWISVGNPVRSDAKGNFVLSTGSETYVLLSAEGDGYARSFCDRTLSPNETGTLEMVLNRPATPIIELVDSAGHPVQGARVREYRQRGANGGLRMVQLGIRSLKLEFPISDARGHLKLPALTRGDILNVTIEHPQLAPLEVVDVPVKEGVVARGTMKPGVVLTLRQSGEIANSKIPWAVLDLRHESMRHPSTIVHYEVEFDPEGKAQLAVERGDYQFLRLQHDDYYLTPTYQREGSKREKLEIGLGTNDDLKFDVHPRISARGRVVDAETGEPLSGADLLGEIASRETVGLSHLEKWSFTNWAETDANGEYTLSVAAGRARISFHGDQRVSETEFVEFTAAADGSTKIPDVRVRRLPRIRGIVQQPDGTPVERAVVRLRGTSVAGLQPVLTDAQGRFELQPEFVPTDETTGLRAFAQQIVAFDPLRPLAARKEVRLDKPELVTLTMEPTVPDWPLLAIPDEISDWQKGIVPEDRKDELARITLKGKPFPELDGIGWINSPALKLADLRGKYVLLDFWFIGCGPCHYDFASVKLVHELYKDNGVVVIGVHNNSKPLETVREHVEKIGLPFPVMVDYPDGRTVAQLEPHGIPGGYPCYVLIDPAGRVLFDDRTIPAYSLRLFKLEIIRNLLLRRDLR